MLNHFGKGIGARGARTEQEGQDGQRGAFAELISITRGSDCAAHWDHGTGGVTHHALQLIVQGSRTVRPSDRATQPSVDQKSPMARTWHLHGPTRRAMAWPVAEFKFDGSP